MPKHVRVVFCLLWKLSTAQLRHSMPLSNIFPVIKTFPFLSFFQILSLNVNIVSAVDTMLMFKERIWKKHLLQ